jgi:hypothetical protein
MIRNKLKDKPYDIIALFNEVKSDMNKELNANGYKSIGSRSFKQAVKHYFKHICNRVIYKYQTVEIYNRFGSLTGHKILCTEYNPPNIDVNKTDGYFFFLFWRRPKAYVRWAFKLAPIWKKRIFQNVRDNGGDYPEINEMTYGIYR